MKNTSFIVLKYHEEYQFHCFKIPWIKKKINQEDNVKVEILKCIILI